MTGLNLVPAILVGLLGGVHCMGMCGGIVSALSVASGPRKPFPVAVAGSAAALTQAHAWMRRRDLRIAAGLVVLAFSMLGLARAAHGLSPEWLDALCINLPPAGAHR